MRGLDTSIASDLSVDRPAGAIGAQVIVPMHDDPFVDNRGSPEGPVEGALRDHHGAVFDLARGILDLRASARPR
jgi:hypothetical protein